jgi:hypothetical protein
MVRMHSQLDELRYLTEIAVDNDAAAAESF